MTIEQKRQSAWDAIGKIRDELYAADGDWHDTIIYLTLARERLRSGDSAGAPARRRLAMLLLMDALSEVDGRSATLWNRIANVAADLTV